MIKTSLIIKENAITELINVPHNYYNVKIFLFFLVKWIEYYFSTKSGSLEQTVYYIFGILLLSTNSSELR